MRVKNPQGKIVEVDSASLDSIVDLKVGKDATDEQKMKAKETALDSIFAQQEEIDVDNAHEKVLKERVRASEILFPRTTRAIKSGHIDASRSSSLHHPAPMLDFLSGLLTGPTALGRYFDTKTGTHLGDSEGRPETYLDTYQQVSEGKNPEGDPSIITQSISDPAAIPSMVTGSQGAKWVLKGGKWVAKLAKTALVGAGEGAVSGTIHQAENVAEGKEISEKEMVKEIGSSALLNTLIPVVGELFKKSGTKFFTAGAKALENKTHVKKGADVENLFKHKLSGGLDKSLSNVEDKISLLGEDLLKIVKKKKGNINLNEIFEQTEKEFLETIEKGKLTGQNKQIMKAIDELREELAVSAPKGTGNLEKLLNIKRGWGKLGKFVRDASPELSAKQEVANKLSANFNKKLLELAPEATKLNKSLSELIPLKQPLKDAVAQAKRNDAISMGDMLLLIAGGGSGGLAGGGAGAGGGIGLTAALIAARRLSKSPKFGSELRKAGEKVLKQQDISPIITQTGRTKAREVTGE